MAQLPNQKKILREDLKEAPSWIDKLIFPLNSFMESVYYALNKNITFTENIASQIDDIRFTTRSDYSTATPKIDGFDVLRFRHTLSTKPIGVQILSISKRGDFYVPITEPVTVDWREANGIIFINYITGLENSTTYDLRLLII